MKKIRDLILNTDNDQEEFEGFYSGSEEELIF